MLCNVLALTFSKNLLHSLPFFTFAQWLSYSSISDCFMVATVGCTFLTNRLKQNKTKKQTTTTKQNKQLTFRFIQGDGKWSSCFFQGSGSAVVRSIAAPFYRGDDQICSKRLLNLHILKCPFYFRWWISTYRTAQRNTVTQVCLIRCLWTQSVVFHGI